MKVQFQIQRFDPEVDPQPYSRCYEIDAAPEERILDCLNRIRWEQDGTLAYRMSCAHGVCGSDAMRINGRCGLACQKLVKDIGDGQVRLEPLPSFRVLKDLVVDMEPFLERVRLIRPYLAAPEPTPGRERQQSPAEHSKIDLAIRCILCACCTAACPVTAGNAAYIGPAPLVWAFRYIFDSRDQDTLQRLEQADHPDRVWACVNHYECTRACPKDIPVTKCINTIKKEIRKVMTQAEKL